MAARWPVLPSAAQLEVVRLLAGSRGAPGQELASLADLVAGTPVGGRGPVDSSLAWERDRPGVGAPPVEPDELPARELLRVCVTVLARLARSGEPAQVDPGRARRRPWHRTFVVDGTSPQARAVRAAVRRAGRAEGGRRPAVLVVGGPLDAMLAMHWRRRVERGSGVRWRRVWSRVVASGALPDHVDLAAAAESWAGRVGAANVHVVLERDPSTAVAVAGRLLGVRLDAVSGPGCDVVDTDLLRRLNQVLVIDGSQATGTLLAGRFGVSFRTPWGPPLGVPAAQLGWAVERAEAMATRLADGGFVLHGDPRLVVPSSDASLPRSVDPAETLARAIAVLPGFARLAAGQAATG